MSKAESQVMEKTIAAAEEIAATAVDRPAGCPLCGSSTISHFLSGPDRFHGRVQVFHLLRCSSCSGVWLDNPPKPEQMGFHYDEDYHKTIMMAGETSADIRWRRHHELISRYKQGGAILDIGCSSGAFLKTMKSDAWKLYGIELEASTAQKARAATGAEVFVGDVEEAPFAPGSFDVITAFDLLEHVYHPRQFLALVHQWLKPGGIFFVMLPNIESLESRLLGNYWYGLELPRHLTHFSPRSLRRVLTSMGFQESFLATSNTYAERSLGYVYCTILEKFGASPPPASKAAKGTIPVRALRKMLRLALIRPAGQIASLAGAGANIEAIFTKPAAPNGAARKQQD